MFITYDDIISMKKKIIESDDVVEHAVCWVRSDLSDV